MAMQTVDTVRNNTSRVDLGYRASRRACRPVFSDFIFATANLPGQRQRGLMALGDFLIECIDLLDLVSADGSALDVWKEIREDLEHAFAGRPSTPRRASLADTVERFSIPQSHLFDMLDGADIWIRNRQFETFEQTTTFTEKFGGGMMAACVPVLGFVNPDYQASAIKCGQAIHLTHILNNLLPDLKQHKNFLAQEDYRDCGIDLARLQMRRPGPQFRHFVRQYTARIEKLYQQGGKLVGELEFSGARTVTSILDCHWKVFARMRAEPELILGTKKILTRQDKFRLRTRHMMGLEGTSPVIDRGVAVH